jgi:acyl dehydratase
MPIEEMSLGDELETHPDVSLDNVKRFTRAAKLTFGRFVDHAQARKEGLPGAIVPGIMSQGLLVAAIHSFAPGCEIQNIDTVFRAPVLVDSKPAVRVVVTDVDPAERTVALDLTITNEAGETRVAGTASVRL